MVWIGPDGRTWIFTAPRCSRRAPAANVNSCSCVRWVCSLSFVFPALRSLGEGGLPLLSANDLRPDPPVVPRFLRLEAARRRAVVVPDADRPQPAFHERRHEPVRALLPRRPGGPVEARGRHPEMHPRGRQAQRPRGRRFRHLPPHDVRDAGQLVLRRLLQAGLADLGLGAADQGLGHPAEAPLRHDLPARQVQGRSRRA